MEGGDDGGMDGGEGGEGGEGAAGERSSLAPRENNCSPREAQCGATAARGRRRLACTICLQRNEKESFA